MGLVEYISRQPNLEAKITNKYDEEFAVATITRICDAIAPSTNLCKYHTAKLPITAL